MRKQVGAILLGCEEHEVGHALGHQGRDLHEVVGPALDVLSHEVVDVAVQAIGHRVLPSLSVKSSPPISSANEQRGSRMRKARRGWTMPKEDARSMLRMIEERIRSSDIRVEHRDALIRLRAMIEDDLEGSARGEAASWPSSCAMVGGKYPARQILRSASPEVIMRYPDPTYAS